MLARFALLTFADLKPERSETPYVPRIFGFKIYKGAQTTTNSGGAKPTGEQKKASGPAAGQP